jgi:hypothetical protein
MKPLKKLAPCLYFVAAPPASLKALHTLTVMSIAFMMSPADQPKAAMLEGGSTDQIRYLMRKMEGENKMLLEGIDWADRMITLG